MISLDIKPISTTIRVYVSNLGAYNSGVLTGKWTTLPVKDVKSIYENDRQKYGTVSGYGEEYFISDYEAPFTINEYENIEVLNKLAKSFKENNLNDIEDAYNFLDNKENTYINEPIEFTEDNFNMLTEGLSNIEVARAVLFGSFKNWNDDLIRWDNVGNLETLTYYEWYEELNKNSDEIIKEYKEENF